MDVEALVRPVVESAGLEFVEASLGKEGGRRVLRVTVDREGGVDLDTISRVSDQVSRRLDLDDVQIPGSYALEVSSPGVERPLRTPHEFERFVGRQVRVRTAEPIEGSRTHSGPLVSAGVDAVVVATAEGDRRLPFADITSARTVFDWHREKRSAR